MVQLQALLILGVVGIFYYLSMTDTNFDLPGLHFTTEENHSVVISGPNDEPVLTGNLGLNYKLEGMVRKCKDGKSEDAMCAEWEGVVKLWMGSYHEGPAQCYDIRWLPQTKDTVPHDCFNVQGAHWYGGAERKHDRWPIESQPTPMIHYLGYDVGMVNYSTYGSILERYWFSSKGVAIFVEDDVPLHVGINSEQICFKADYDNSWYPKFQNSDLPKLRYSVCIAEDVKVIHKFMAGKHFKKPLGIPDERVLKEPIWSTWAQYKTNITQEKTLEYSNAIHKYGFPASQVEIDDMYTPKYGDYTFNKKKFPDPLTMSKHIHDKLGFKITSWVMPFANTDSLAFQEGLEKGFWVMDETGKVPGLIKWWQGTGVILDATNPDAVDWFFNRLANLQKQGVDSFKFDAGEINFLPPHFTTHKPLQNPNHYSKYYAEAIHAHADRIIEVRVGYKTQHLPVLIRMMDKDSNWGYSRGFKTMIPTALICGVLGYPFVLPDMIGGNAYSDSGFGPGSLPEKELYIRWLELNIFLPSMQFSIPPWQYDQETIDITHKLLKLRESYVNNHVINLAHESTKTGDPIVRPLWWASPKDPKTFNDDTEFLVGDNILVAPILDKGSQARDIYLPEGKWKDMLRGSTVLGPTTLTNYKVALDEIAYFERVQ